MCWIFPTFSVVISDMHRFHVLVAEKRDLEEFSELQEIKQENQNEGWIWHHGANWILQAWFGLKLSIISFSGGHVVPYFSLCLLRKQNVSTFLSVWLRTDAALEKSFASVCNLVVLPCCFLLRVKVYWEFVSISKRVLFQLRDFIKKQPLTGDCKEMHSLFTNGSAALRWKWKGKHTLWTEFPCNVR